MKNRKIKYYSDKTYADIRYQIDYILSIIFTYDFESIKGIIIRKNEVDILFNYRFKLQDMLEEKHDELNVIDYLKRCDRDTRMIHLDCNKRLKDLKKYDSDKLKESVMNTKTF